MYDFVQRGQIKAARAAASTAQDEVQRQARRSREEIGVLEDRVAQLTMMCEAMWQLLCETTGLTDAHLAYRLYELDQSDGQQDGRKAVKANPCSECGAMVNSKLENCQFCGATAPERSPWDKI